MLRTVRGSGCGSDAGTSLLCRGGRPDPPQPADADLQRPPSRPCAQRHRRVPTSSSTWSRTRSCWARRSPTTSSSNVSDVTADGQRDLDVTVFTGDRQRPIAKLRRSDHQSGLHLVPRQVRRKLPHGCGRQAALPQGAHARRVCRQGQDRGRASSSSAASRSTATK